MKTSIVIATYNRPELVLEAIASALNQTVPCEIVVVNDGGTPPPIPQAVKLYDVVKYFDRPHLGAAATWNFGYQQATGDFVFNLDDDDLLVENTIERLTEEIGDADVIFSDLLLYPSLAAFRQKFEGYEALCKNNTMPDPKLMRREVALKVPVPDLATGWDYERNLQMCEAGLKIKHLPEFLYLYRQHDGQIQKQKSLEQTENNKNSSALRLVR